MFLPPTSKPKAYQSNQEVNVDFFGGSVVIRAKHNKRNPTGA